MFNGSPEHVGTLVPDCSVQDGGYIMVLELESGSPRIVATRFPAKNVTSWRSRSARYGGVPLRRVLITRAHPRYEKIKRLLAYELSVDSDGNAITDPLTVEHIHKKLAHLFDTLAPKVERLNANSAVHTTH